MTHTSQLAVVIPAVKPDFLAEALASIAGQTDRRFRVYVGDDAGPPEVERICSQYRSAGVDLTYRRFHQNLGARSLAAQWNRCVSLSSEPWVWLFSDDDVMEAGCVAALRQVIEGGTPAHLLRFDTLTIDRAGEVMRENPLHPEEESGAEFVFARLSGVRESFAVEYVFRRDAFERTGGFPDFPVGWAADDAAWFLFTGERPIVKVPGSRVRWRASGLNITSLPGRFQREKLEGAARFVDLVLLQVRHADRGGRSPDEWASAAERWYLGQLRSLMPVSPALWPMVLSTSRQAWRAGAASKLLRLARWSLSAETRGR